MLNIDRSTVYRMAEDGRLPAIRVGRSWRFPADRIEALLGSPRPEIPRLSDVEPGTGEPADDSADLTQDLDEPIPGLNRAAASAAVEVAAELLGVMMVVTDMHGNPITGVVNPSQWFAERAEDPQVLDRCVNEWRDLADHPDLTPRFQSGALGFQCARAFIRNGTTLVGMVLAGGVSPSDDMSVDADLYHLDDAARQRVLTALPRIAAAISTSAPRTAATTPTAPSTGADTKEN